MRRHLIFICCLIAVFFCSGFYWMNDPYGNVTYKVELDSASLNQIFYDLEIERCNELLEKGKLKTTDTLYIKGDREKGCFNIVLNNNIEIDFHLEDEGKVVLSFARYKKEDRPLIYEFFGADCVQDYVVWHSFEKEILDELGLKYRKRWGPFIRKWYASWFFDNQLFIACLAILIHIVCSIIRNIKHKKEYGYLIFLFCLGTLVFWSDIIYVVVTNRNRDDCWGEVCYEVEMDSTKLVPIFHKLASDRYELLFYEGQLWESHIQLWNPDRKDKYSFIPLDYNTLWVCADICKDPDRAGFSEICLSGGGLIVGKHFSVCNTFEKEVLDKLALKYKKHWSAVLQNWYPRWFFHNQLYIIGVALLLLLMCHLIKKIIQKRQLTVAVNPPTLE